MTTIVLQYSVERTFRLKCAARSGADSHIWHTIGEVADSYGSPVRIAGQGGTIWRRFRLNCCYFGPCGRSCCGRPLGVSLRSPWELALITRAIRSEWTS